MDTDKYLLLIQGKDRTEEVVSYSYLGPKIRIVYRDGPQMYTRADVLILDNPECIRIAASMVVSRDEYPFTNVTYVQVFGSKTKVYFANGTNRIYNAKSIQIKNCGIPHGQAAAIIEDWRELSKLVKREGETEYEESFLANEYSKLKSIHPDSVLSRYLNAAAIQTETAIDSDLIFPFRYNLSQRTAVQQALHSAISIIEGPPGTGKTQTILNIIANLVVMKNKTVAVVSGNNAAVANVRDKLEKDGYHFIAATLGKRDNKQNFFANLPSWDVTGWESDQSEHELLKKLSELDRSIRQLMELDRERAIARRKLAAYLLEQQHFAKFCLDHGIEPLEKLSFYRLTSDRIMEFMKDCYMAAELGKEDSLAYKFKLFFKHGYTGFERLKTQGQSVVLTYQHRFYELKVKELTHRIEEMDRKLQSLQTLMDTHHGLSLELMRHRLHRKYSKLKQVNCDEGSYKNIRNFKGFMVTYPVMLSTTHSLRNCVPDNYLFDYCIIDESSQVDLLTGALALSCCKNAIIVGDTKQLPHIVGMNMENRLGREAKSPIPAAYDYFRHNVLSSLLELYGGSVPRVMLREHYRCHPRIIEFCNRKYYNEELIVFTDEADSDQPLLIYRTARGNHMRDGRAGKFNQRELDVIEQEILRGYLEGSSHSKDIGIVTPYRHQADKASAQLEDLAESDTIHKYQGREKPIMILTTVLDQSRYGKMGMKFVNDPCKINVAVSRAQDQFILVTDGGAFGKYGNEISDLMRYMDYSTLDSNVTESEIVSIFDLLYREYSDKLRKFREKVEQRQTSRFKSENIMHTALKTILSEAKYKGFRLAYQVFLLHLFSNLDALDEEERKYIRNRASVDFVIYHQFDNSPALAIEVDGFAFHENNPTQLQRDRKKDNIFKKFALDLQRFPTTGSGEEARLRALLDRHLGSKLEG